MSAAGKPRIAAVATLTGLITAAIGLAGLAHVPWRGFVGMVVVLVCVLIAAEEALRATHYDDEIRWLRIALVVALLIPVALWAYHQWLDSRDPLTPHVRHGCHSGGRRRASSIGFPGDPPTFAAPHRPPCPPRRHRPGRAHWHRLPAAARPPTTPRSGRRSTSTPLAKENTDHPATARTVHNTGEPNPSRATRPTPNSGHHLPILKTETPMMLDIIQRYFGFTTMPHGRGLAPKLDTWWPSARSNAAIFTAGFASITDPAVSVAVLVRSRG